jgi:Fe-S cluster assembly protein SufD
LQEWADNAVHASSQQAKIGRDAKFKHIVVSLGGDLVRVTPSTRFTAPGAESKCSACTSPTPGSTWSSVLR